MGDSLYNDEDSTTVLVADDTNQNSYGQQPNIYSQPQNSYSQQAFNQNGYNQVQNNYNQSGYGQQNLNQNGYNQVQNSYGQPQNNYGQPQNSYGQQVFSQNSYNQVQNSYNQNSYGQAQSNYGNPYGQAGFNQNIPPMPAKEPKKPMDEAAKDKLHRTLSLTALGIAGAGFIIVIILTLFSNFFSATSDFKGSYKDSLNTTEAATEAVSTDNGNASADDDTSADGTNNASTEQEEE